MKKVYNLQQQLYANGRSVRMGLLITVSLLFLLLSFNASAQKPVYDLTHTGTSGNCFAAGTTYQIGLSNTIAFDYYVLFRVTLNGNYEKEYEVAAWNQNEGGGVINLGTFGSAGKYIIIRFDDNKFNNIGGKNPLEDYLATGATLEDNTTVQNGEFWVIAQAAERDFVFTGDDGTDYQLVGTSTTTAEFCEAGSVTVVNPEFSPPGYDDTGGWDVHYTLLNNGVQAVDLDGVLVPTVENPDSDIVWDNLPDGNYTVRAERSPCPETILGPLEIIIVAPQNDVVMALIDDISTVTHTPVIFDIEIEYPDLTGTDPSVLVDALIEFNGQLPAGAEIIELYYDGSPVPMDNPGAIAGTDEVLLSHIIGDPPATLQSHSLRTDTWTIVAVGVENPSSYNITVKSVAYTGDYATSFCKIDLATQVFTVTFADADLDLVIEPDPACYPDDDPEFRLTLTHPAIDPVTGIILSNATIASDKEINAGTVISYVYDPGGPDEASGDFTIGTATNEVYLSEIVTGTQGELISPNLFGHTGAIDWAFSIEGLEPGTYNFDIQAAAQLPDGTLFPYATMAPPLQIIVVGALDVQLSSIADISTITGTPIIVPFTMTYPDLTAQDIHPSVLTDARITYNGTGTFPEGARIFDITYNGASVLAAPYTLGAGVDEILLSTILGSAPTSLLGHSGLTIEWEFFIDGVEDEVIIPIAVEAIAYIDYNECYSVMDEDDFTVTFADVSITAIDDIEVCYPADIVFGWDITYPLVENVDPDRVLNDSRFLFFADAGFTTPLELPAGTEIEVLTPIGNTWSVVLGTAVDVVYGSAIVAENDPPNTNEDGFLLGLERPAQTNSWQVTIKGADPSTVYVVVENFAILDKDASGWPYDANDDDYMYASQDFKVTYIGAKDVELSPIADISTITGTPIIVPFTMTYPDLNAQNIDPAVLTDARITYNGTGTFPEGARIFDITYNGASVLAAPYVFGPGENDLLMSEILGSAPTSLLGHSGLTIEWEFFIDGVEDEVTIPIAVEAIAYLDINECYAVLDADDFIVTFADAEHELTGTFTACYPLDGSPGEELVVNSVTTYPTINVDPRVKSDALITTDVAFNEGAQIQILHNANPYLTYTVPAGGISEAYVSELLGSGPNPLAAESGKIDDTWTFVITNLNPGTYNVNVKPVARLDEVTGPPTTYVDYPYADDDVKLIVVGALDVVMEPIADINTVTGAPVVFEVEIAYPDLLAQNIDPTVLVDALITFDKPLPATAEVVDIYITRVVGGSTFTQGFVPASIAGLTEIYLTDLVGTIPEPLIDVNETTDTWTITIAGFDVEETYTATVEVIAYVDKTICYSVMDDETFSVTYNDLDITADPVTDVCFGDDVELSLELVYPEINNIPADITTDAIITANLDIPQGTVVNWDYNNGADSGTYTLPADLDAGDAIYLSTIVGGVPTPLLGHDQLTLAWSFDLVGLPVGAYEINITPIAILDGDEYDIVTNPEPIQFTFNVFALPDPTITGPVDVFSGGDYTYSVEEPTGTPTYSWSANNPAVVFDNAGIQSPTVTFEWPLTGTVEITVVVGNSTCSDTFTLEVEVHPNLLVGQVKYYNQQESPMPSPFMTNFDGNTIPDYFYVALLSPSFSFEGTQNPREAAIEWHKVDEIYWGDVDGDDPDDIIVLEAAFAFEYNLDPAVDYKIAVWDGGYFEEMENGAWEYPDDLSKGVLGKSWTWDNWGGVNATDALIIQHMVVGTDMDNWTLMQHVGSVNDSPKYGAFAFDVADVNNHGGLTALDALLTARRGIGLLQAFPRNKPNFSVAGIFVDHDDFNTNNIFNDQIPSLFEYPGHPNYNWSTLAVDHYYGLALSEIKNREVLGNSYLNIYYNATGDINASYKPVYGSSKSTDSALYFADEKNVSIGDKVSIPVSLTEFVNIGAFSLGMEFRNDLIEIVGTNYEADIAHFDNETGMLRIAWASLDGISFSEKEAVAIIALRVIDDIPAGTALFKLTGFTEIADTKAKAIQGIDFQTIALSTDPVSVISPDAATLNAANYPNPFNNTTTISYELPETGSVNLVVYNKVGQVVKTLVDETQPAGTHEVTLSSSYLQGPGVYFYKLELRGVSNHYGVTNSMILIR